MVIQNITISSKVFISSLSLSIKFKVNLCVLVPATAILFKSFVNMFLVISNFSLSVKSSCAIIVSIIETVFNNCFSFCLPIAPYWSVFNKCLENQYIFLNGLFCILSCIVSYIAPIFLSINTRLRHFAIS